MGKRTLIFAGVILAILVGITGNAAYAATTNTFTLTDAIFGWTYQEGNLTGQRLTANWRTCHPAFPSTDSINSRRTGGGTGPAPATFADTREYALSNETAFTQVSSKPSPVDLSGTCGEWHPCRSASIPTRLSTHGHQQHSRLR